MSKIPYIKPKISDVDLDKDIMLLMASGEVGDLGSPFSLPVNGASTYSTKPSETFDHDPFKTEEFK